MTNIKEKFKIKTNDFSCSKDCIEYKNLKNISSQIELSIDNESIQYNKLNSYNTLQFIEDLLIELQENPELLSDIFPERLKRFSDRTLSRFWNHHERFIDKLKLKINKFNSEYSFNSKDLNNLKDKCINNYNDKALDFIKIIDIYQNNEIDTLTFIKKIKNELGKISGKIEISKKELSILFGHYSGFISEIISKIKKSNIQKSYPDYKFSIENLKDLEENLIEISHPSLKRFLKLIKKYRDLNLDLKEYSKQQYTIKNPYLFSKIILLSTAYWYGFLCADGWISKICENRYRIGFKLAKKDRDRVNSFADSVGFKQNRIREVYQFRKNNNGEIKLYESLSIEFCCKPMYKDLIKHGFDDFKFNREGIPLFVKNAIKQAKGEVNSKNLHWSQTYNGKIAYSWLLGLYDGDGHYRGGYSAEIYSSNEQLLQEIKKLFECPNEVRTLTEPGEIKLIFSKETICKGYYVITTGSEIFKRMVLSYRNSMQRKRP